MVVPLSFTGHVLVFLEKKEHPQQLCIMALQRGVGSLSLIFHSMLLQYSFDLTVSIESCIFVCLHINC